MTDYYAVPVPVRSPYLADNQPVKEVFRFCNTKMNHHGVTPSMRSLLDVGCATGSFIQSLGGLTDYVETTGIDLSPEYIAAAKAKGLRAAFICGDVFELSGQWDVVTCHGTMPAFRDPEPLLGKLLSLLRAGGWLFVSGLFNPLPVDVRVEFRDATEPNSKMLWRSNQNIHSQDRIGVYLRSRVQFHAFDEVPMTVDLPRDPGKPAAHVWTFKDEAGKRIITSGVGMILTDWLLSAQKAS